MYHRHFRHPTPTTAQDKFDRFERWLRDNGGKFDLVRLENVDGVVLDIGFTRNVAAVMRKGHERLNQLMVGPNLLSCRRKAAVTLEFCGRLS